MEKEVGEIAKVAGLNVEGIAALETASGTAIEKCLNVWLEKFDEWFRAEYAKSPPQLITSFDQFSTQVESIAIVALGIEGERPDDTPEWSYAVMRILTPNQANAWQKVVAERKLARDREIEACLIPMSAAVRENLARNVRVKCLEIKTALALSGERAKAVDEAAESSVEQTTALWRTRAATMVASSEDEERDALKKGEMAISPDPGEMPWKQSAWKEGLAKILSSREVQQLQIAQQERRGRRVQALGRMLIAELELKVAFTSTQRERLQPLAERLVDGPVFFPEDQPDDFVIIFIGEGFKKAGAAASQEELRTILDGAQCKGWKKACDSEATETNSELAEAPSAGPPRDERLSAATAEPEDMEAAMSDFLSETTNAARKRHLDFMTLQAEDVARLAGVSRETSRSLLIAAKGATEGSLARWKSELAEVARGSIGDATAANVKQQLSNALSNIIGNDPKIPFETLPAWETAVKTQLSHEQRMKWEKEISQRNAFKVKAVAALVLSEFDRKDPISLEQWKKLEPIVSNFEDRYAPEIESICNNQWFFQQPAMFTPLASIPENELIAILSKEQIESWEKLKDGSMVVNNWSFIQKAYAHRVKGTK